MIDSQSPTSDGVLAPEDEESISGFCPRYHYAIELIGRRWTGAILRVLFGGPKRFNALLAAIPGLSDRLLSDRLRELETERLVVRRVLAGPPVRVEYELTEAGYDLQGAVKAVAFWAHKWLPS